MKLTTTERVVLALAALVGIWVLADIWTLADGVERFERLASPSTGAAPELPTDAGAHADAQAQNASTEAASVGSLTPEPKAAHLIGDEPDAVLSSESSGLGGVLPGVGLDEAMLPTPEGLFASTVELWSQPEFLELSTERAARLVPPISDGYDFSLPTTIMGFIGGDLPTLEDCRRGLRDEVARELHTELCLQELAVSDLQEMPRTRRGPEFTRRLEEARRMRDDTSAALTGRLDEVGSYKNWRLLDRLYREWRK
jgi:hypothetical protein